MRHILACALTGAFAMTAAASHAASTTYKLVKTINLPGAKGGHGDWTIYDPATNTVWLSQSPDHAVVVIDAKTNKVAHVIHGIANANGIAFAGPYTFVADNASDGVVVIKNDKKIATLHAGKGPDAINYLTKENKIYVSSGDNQATEFDAKPPFKKTASFTLKPNPAKDGPDISAYVAQTDQILQPDDNVIDVINAKTNKIEAVWSPGIKTTAKAVAYDSKTGHVILGTSDKTELILDGKTGNVIATIPVKGAVDATVVDPGARRAFVADKAGLVEVIDLDTNKLVATIPSEKKMHTLGVDTRNHRVYVYRNVSNKVDVYAPAG